MRKRRTAKRWFSELLIRAAMASGVGYFAAAYTVSRWLTRPTRQRMPVPPNDAGWVCEALECRTSDRVRLAGWAIAPPAPRGNVILFHGLRHHREKLLGRIALLAGAGYRCIAFDHRAHGESGGQRTSFGYHESKDVEAVLAMSASRWPAEPSAALGISMGAAALCFAASKTRRLQAVVLESLYHDVENAFRSRIGTHYPGWFKRLGPAVVWVTERRLRLRIKQMRPADHIGGLAPAPLLLLTGMNDLHASPKEALRLYHRYPGPRELWIVPGAGHRDLFETATSDYATRVLSFLERHLDRDAKRASPPLSTSA